MQLLTPLINGFADAPNGTAVIYRRGTTTRSWCFADFNGTQPTRTHQLDSRGRLARWVDEIVDVTIYDADGTALITFTFAEGATALEIRHSRWTGTDYDTGQSALGKPLTLQTLLDTLYTSLGASDGMVDVGGVATLIKNALGRLTGVYDVTLSPYGATGDGVADDTAEINAAIVAAAAAGGGIVYLPPDRDFRITAALDFSIVNGEKVGLVGGGGASTFLSMDHGSNNWLNLGNAGPAAGWQVIHGIRFRALQANTGFMLADAAGNWKRYKITNCAFEGSQNSIVRIQTASQLVFEDCVFTLSSASVNQNAIHSVNTTGNGPVYLHRCTFVGPAGAWNPAVAVIYCPAVHLTACDFQFAATTGTGNLVDFRGVGRSSVLGNDFSALGATWRAFFNAAESFVENDNIFSAAAGSPLYYRDPLGANQKYAHFGTRMQRTQIEANTVVPATVSPDLLNYAKYVVPVTAGGANTLTITPVSMEGFDGFEWTLLIKNTGGGTVTVVFTDVGGFTWRELVVNPLTTQHIVYKFIKHGTIWTQAQAATGIT